MNAYAKVSVNRLADGVAYLMILKKVEGDFPNDIIPLLIQDELIFQEGNESELN
jgi:hypothetical protein